MLMDVIMHKVIKLGTLHLNAQDSVVFLNVAVLSFSVYSVCLCLFMWVRLFLQMNIRSNTICMNALQTQKVLTYRSNMFMYRTSKVHPCVSKNSSWELLVVIGVFSHITWIHQSIESQLVIFTVDVQIFSFCLITSKTSDSEPFGLRHGSKLRTLVMKNMWYDWKLQCTYLIDLSDRLTEQPGWGANIFASKSIKRGAPF